MAEKIFLTGMGRVFLQRYGGSPKNPVTYLGCHRLTGLAKAEGDLTPVYCPDPDAYSTYEVVDTIRGAAGLPTTSLVGKFGKDNPVLNLACAFDLQAHFGKCKDPTNFDAGWDKIIAFKKGQITNRAADNLTALEPGDEAQILLTADITAEDFIEIDPLTFGQKAQNEVLTEALDAVICDKPQCGECGVDSGGCDKIYVATKDSGVGSPGLPAEIVYSEDGGVTWADETIDTLASGEDPDAIACMGDYLVVVSHASDSLHYALRTDLNTWVEITGGILPAGSPNALWASDAFNLWVVGDGGYIYWTDDVTAGVAVQDAGSATAQVLHAVHGLNSQFVVAVGAAGAVVYTENGGSTWSTVAGAGLPAVVLNCVWVRSEYCWIVGTAGGELWYTVDKGATWTEKVFSGSGSGNVWDIAFSKGNDGVVGYMTHATTGPAGRIFRTMNGGYSWHLLPETGTLTANDRFNALATCDNPNFVVAAGLADASADGVVVIGSN